MRELSQRPSRNYLLQSDCWKTLQKGRRLSIFQLSSLKHTVSAGEALPDATRPLWKKATGIEMTDGIGGTEVIHIYISSAGQEVRAGSIGKVVPGYQAQIVDEDMKYAMTKFTTKHLLFSA